MWSKETNQSILTVLIGIFIIVMTIWCTIMYVMIQSDLEAYKVVTNKKNWCEKYLYGDNEYWETNYSELINLSYGGIQHNITTYKTEGFEVVD